MDVPRAVWGIRRSRQLGRIAAVLDAGPARERPVALTRQAAELRCTNSQGGAACTTSTQIGRRDRWSTALRSSVPEWGSPLVTIAGATRE